MFLKNKNIIFKIRRSKVTDYAALSKTIIFLRFQRGSIIFRGGGRVQLFPWGGGLTSVETYRTCDFPGEGVRTPSGSARGYDRSTCDIQNFQVLSKANREGQVFLCNNGSFSIARATSDTSKHDEVHDSGYFIWFYIEHTGTLNGISMC